MKLEVVVLPVSKVWFITGVSRGFGLEIARAALAAGDQVVATVRTQPAQLATILHNHPNLYVVQMDVTISRKERSAALKSHSLDERHANTVQI